MLIEIRQQAGTVTHEYSISVDGNAAYFAFQAFRNFRTYIDVWSAPGVTPPLRMKIKRHWSWLNTKYTIRLGDQKEVMLRSTSFFRPTYEARDQQLYYELIGHQDFGASIFVNGVQIASLAKKNIVSILGSDRYTVVANNSADVEMLLAIALIWDNIYGDQAISLGLWWQRQPPDHHWEPEE